MKHPRIVLEDFGGIFPIAQAHKLPVFGAQAAHNCDLRQGKVSPLKDAGYLADLAKTGTLNSLFKYLDSFWFHWTETVDCVMVPRASDTEGLVAWTGEGTPKISDASIVTGGGSTYPTTSRPLGVPAPALAPSLTQLSAGSGDETEKLDLVYFYTYINAYGQEGPPSAAATISDQYPNAQIRLSGLTTGPGGSYDIVYKRIYCITTAGTMNKVADVLLATTTYDHTSGVVNLGIVCSSEDYDEPLDDLHSLVALKNGSLAGISGNQVCLSVPYQGHAWPLSYRYKMNTPGVGLGLVGNMVIVATEGVPHLLVADDPGNAYFEKPETVMPCVSKRGIVDIGSAIAYPTQDGYQVLGPGVNRNLLASLILPEQWRAYKPDSIHAVWFEDRIFAFYDTGTAQGLLIIDPQNEKHPLTTCSLYFDAAYADHKNGNLYLVKDRAGTNEIYEWGEGSDLTYTWTSREMLFPGDLSLGACKVVAAGTNVSMAVYMDGALIDTIVSPTDIPQWIADHAPGRKAYISLSGTDDVLALIFDRSPAAVEKNG